MIYYESIRILKMDGSKVRGALYAGETLAIILVNEVDMKSSRERPIATLGGR